MAANRTRPFDRIALVSSSLKLSGGVKRIFTTAKLLRERGYDAVIYSPTTRVPDWCSYEGLELRPLSASLTAPTDCAIFFNPKFVPYRVLARSPARHKVIYFLLNGGHYRRAYQRWIDRTVRLPDVYLAGNNGRWRTHYDLRGKQTFDLIGGIDTEHFRPPAVPRDPAEPFTILTQGRDPSSFPGKGTAEIIAELEALAPRVRLRVFSNERVGYTSEKLTVEEIVATPPSGMPALYHAADLVVQNEDDTGGWSNVAAEAMACMTPVACTRYTTSDFAHHLETAYVFEREGEPGAIREAVELLLERPELRRAMAVAGRREIERYAWPRVVDDIEAMFAVMAGRSDADLAPRGHALARWIDRWRR